MATLCQVEVVDPDLSLRQYGSRRDHGLPANVVRTLAQSSDGRIWLGTSAGLVFFDGASFRMAGDLADEEAGGRMISSLAGRVRGRQHMDWHLQWSDAAF
ncbi:two-component regulator propeller domain-containing protein [Pelagicoccus sp. SDUM812003]|uniref:two-component regulator propeller domain-containing protein n=1 Tax=Pelagicoccus sp. SDUM812003 TaxID=3041267 RepID=UPI00280DD6CD|nr:two-component regulator propeller domain-containing protein [Pelagicoccus sp. SDUM812003]MDQ8205516.1 two-component regulator propeller domain-containing protein [Pelagicoccus sp. SDUM812003]